MKLEKRIGLAGGTAIVVGGVIGMGAYALVPSIAQKAGNAAWLAMTIAMLVSVVSVLPLIQISSALPVAGGGYMYASRLISPLAGTVTSFWALLGGASSRRVSPTTNSQLQAWPAAEFSATGSISTK